MELTTQARAAIPTSSFAGPKRSFPIENPDHAVAALRMVGRAQAAGHLTQAEADHIRARAHAVLSARNGTGYGAQIMNAAQPQRPIPLQPAPLQIQQP